MTLPKRFRLLHGPFKPPRLYKGDRAVCPFRDCDVVITGCPARLLDWISPHDKAKTAESVAMIGSLAVSVLQPVFFKPDAIPLMLSRTAVSSSSRGSHPVRSRLRITSCRKLSGST